MNGFLKERTAQVGLDMTGDVIRMSILDKSDSIAVPSPDKTAQALKQIWSKNNIKSKKVNLALHLPDLLLHMMTLPMMKDEEIQSVLESKVNKYVAFAGVKTVIGWEKMSEISEAGERKLRVLLAVAKRSLVDPYIAAIEQAGLQIEAITFPCLAALTALKKTSLNGGHRDNKIFVDLDAGQTFVLFLKEGEVAFIHQGDIESLRRDLKNLLEREEKTSGIVLHSQIQVADDWVKELNAELSQSITLELNRTALGLSQLKNPAINLLPAEVKSAAEWRKQLSHFLFSVMWLSIFMILLFFLLYLGSSIIEKQITVVQSELDRPTEQFVQLKEVEDKIREAKKLAAGRQRVAEKRRSSPWKDVFNELIEIMPANVYLSKVEVSQEESIMITGLSISSDDIFDFVNKLKTANTFKNTDLKIVREAEEKGEMVFYSIYAERK